MPSANRTKHSLSHGPPMLEGLKEMQESPGPNVSPEDIVYWSTNGVKWLLQRMIGCAEASLHIIEQTEITVEAQSREQSPRGDRPVVDSAAITMGRSSPHAAFYRGSLSRPRAVGKDLIDDRSGSSSPRAADRSFTEQMRDTVIAQKAAPVLLRLGSMAATGVNQLLHWGQDSNEPSSNEPKVMIIEEDARREPAIGIRHRSSLSYPDSDVSDDLIPAHAHGSKWNQDAFDAVGSSNESNST